MDIISFKPSGGLVINCRVTSGDQRELQACSRYQRRDLTVNFDALPANARYVYVDVHTGNGRPFSQFKAPHVSVFGRHHVEIWRNQFDDLVRDSNVGTLGLFYRTPADCAPYCVPQHCNWVFRGIEQGLCLCQPDIFLVSGATPRSFIPDLASLLEPSTSFVANGRLHRLSRLVCFDDTP